MCEWVQGEPSSSAAPQLLTTLLSVLDSLELGAGLLFLSEGFTRTGWITGLLPPAQAKGTAATFSGPFYSAPLGPGISHCPFPSRTHSAVAGSVVW